MRIAETSDDDATQGAGHKAQAIGQKGREQRDGFILSRKKLFGDNTGHIGIDSKIIPFQHIADDSRNGCFFVF